MVTWFSIQVALLCQREVKKAAAKSQRASKEVSSVQPRARRLMKEALIYWRKYEKVEREQRKKAEKEAMEQRKRDDEMREVEFFFVRDENIVLIALISCRRNASRGS